MKKQDERPQDAIEVDAETEAETTLKDIKKKDLWRFRGGGLGDSLVFRH